MNDEQGSKEPTSSVQESNAIGSSPKKMFGKTSKAEKFWQIKSTGVPTDDPLLGCLVVLTRIEHKPFSAESLTAGLPLVDDKLTPDLFIRAAKRADLSAQLVKRNLKEISNLVLPAVLLLKNQQACITLKQLGKEFPSGNTSVLRTASQEMTKLGCGE